MGNSTDPATTHLALYTNGSVFNHDWGGDVQSNVEFAPLNAMRYDTYVDLGGSVSTPTISIVGDPDLDADGVTDRALRAHWLAESGAISVNGEVRLLRVTVGYELGFDPWLWNSGAYLGSPPPWAGAQDPDSMLRVIFMDGSQVDLTIGNAFEVTPPAPGAAALLGIAGAAGLRRRRA